LRFGPDNLDPRDELLRLVPQETESVCQLSRWVEVQKISAIFSYLFPRLPLSAIDSFGEELLLREANKIIAKTARTLLRKYREANPRVAALAKQLEDISSSINRQIKPRVATHFLENRCVPGPLNQSPAEWVLQRLDLAEFLSPEDRQTTRLFCQRLLVEIKFSAWHDLDPWINCMYKILKSIHQLPNIEYWFLQLELCVFMAQLMRNKLKRAPKLTPQALARDIWSLDNIPLLYPQLRFCASRSIAKLYECLGYLFDNVLFAESKPMHVDHVVQLLLKGMAQKHQLQHFAPTIQKWLGEDGRNSVRVLLIEIMTFFRLGVYPWCSRARRLLRRDWMIRLYADRRVRFRLTFRRVSAFYTKQAGLYALKEYIDWGLSPIRELMAAANPAWLPYSQEIRRLCENWRVGRPLDTDAEMKVYRSKMSSIGASLRIPTDFFSYFFTELGGDDYNPFKRDTPMDLRIRLIMEHPFETLLSQETLQWLIKPLAYSRHTDHLLCRRWLRLCMHVLQGPPRIIHDIEPVLLKFFFGDMGSSRYPAFVRATLSRKAMYYASLISYLWVQLTVISSLTWPKNFCDNALRAMTYRMKHQNVPMDIERQWLLVFCASCRTVHTLMNRPPAISSEHPPIYNPLRDGGFSRELACNLKTSQPYCVRKGSRQAAACSNLPCEAISLRNRIIITPALAAFVCCHPQCGMPTLLSSEFTRFSSYGPMCSKHSLDPRILSAKPTHRQSQSQNHNNTKKKKKKRDPINNSTTTRPPTARREPLLFH